MIDIGKWFDFIYTKLTTSRYTHSFNLVSRIHEKPSSFECYDCKPLLCDYRYIK